MAAREPLNKPGDAIKMKARGRWTQKYPLDTENTVARICKFKREQPRPKEL